MGSMTSYVVAASIARGHRKVLNAMPQEERDKITKATAYIFNISPQEYVVYRTHGVTIVRPKAEKEAYSVTEVHGRVELCDAGIEDTFNEITTTAEQIAADVSAWCNEDGPSLSMASGLKSFGGVFWGTHPQPEPGQLKAAVDRLFAYYKGLVAEADRFYETAPGRQNINDTMRRAGNALGISRPWLYQSKEMTLCPACGYSIAPEVAVCQNCHAILNEAKARKYFPERFVHTHGEAFVSDAQQE